MKGNLFMRRLVSILLVSLAVALSGCGGSGSTSKTPTTPFKPPPSYPSITGNWALTATSAVATQVTAIGGYITNTNGTVSGILHILTSPCFALTTDVPITGTVSTAGVVSAISSAVGGQIITLSGTVASGSLTAGKYSIAGGCGNGDQGTVTGFIAPPFTNTYTGTFQSISGVSVGATIAAIQSGPDANGLYAVTGTATFTGSPCFTSATISSSAVSGAYVDLVLANNDGSQTSFVGYITDSTGKLVSGSYQVVGGKCSGDQGSGVLSN
jgi:hypothetical protein